MKKWELIPLGKIAEIDRSIIEPGKIEFGTAYVGLENIESGGRFLNVQEVSNGDLASSKFVFTDRHVLYGKLRPYLAKIACPTFEGICSTDILPILPGPRVDRTYLAYYLRQPDMVELAASRATGANLPRLSPKILEEFEIPLPPLPEQQRIASILDAAEALREKRRQAIAKLDRLVQAVFVEMFGDPVNNPKGWQLIRFGDSGTLDRGVSKHRPRNAPELLGGSHPLIQTGEVANSGGYIRSYSSTYSDLGLRQSKMWPAGTLCITIAANIAKTGILTFDACFPDSVVGFKPGQHTTTEYVQHWLSFLQRELEAQAPQVAQKNINLAILRDLNLPLPPKPLQQRFSDFVNSVNHIKSQQSDSLTHLDTLFTSLQQRAFRGEL